MADNTKKWLKRIGAGVLALVVLVVGVPFGVGSLMARDHVASREELIAAPPAEVWKTIADFEAMPTWAHDMGKVQRLDDAGGKPKFLQTQDDFKITFTFAEIDEPRRLVVDLADDAQYFGGTWTYELGAEGAQTRVKITERGWAGPGFFRFMLWAFGPDATIKQYLADLKKKHGG